MSVQKTFSLQKLFFSDGIVTDVFSFVDNPAAAPLCYSQLMIITMIHPLNVHFSFLSLALATTTTTAEATTEEMSTEPQFEFITFNPEFNNEVPSGSDSYLNRPQLNVAYSTSRAAECSFHNVWVIAIMSLTKLLIMAR